QYPVRDLGPRGRFLPFGMTRTAEGAIVASGYTGTKAEMMAGRRGTVAFLISHDEGTDWSHLSTIEHDHPFDLSETSILPTRDGELLAVMRADWNHTPPEERPEEARRGLGYFLYQSKSSDGGRRWSEPTQLPIWGHPPHLLRLHSGNILMLYGHRRDPYTVR